MLLVPHVLISVSGFIKGENLLVNYRMNIIGRDGTVHVLELQSTANEYSANSADIHQAIEEGWLFFCHAAYKTDNGDNAVDSDGCERL